jgi:TetR/AcrR family transcriptional regulator
MRPNTKDQILEAALKLFSHKGCHGTTVREIASAAAVNVALISYYFGGKEGLYEEVLRREFRCLLDHMERIRDPSMEARSVFAEYITVLDEVHLEHPHIGPLLHQESLHPTKTFEEVIIPEIVEVARGLMFAVRKGIQEGSLRKDLDPLITVYALAALANFRHAFRPVVSKILPESAEQEHHPSFPGMVLDLFLKGVIEPHDTE